MNRKAGWAASALLALVVASLAPASGSAAAGVDAAAYLPVPARSSLEAMRSDVAGLRAAMNAGFATRVRAIMRASGRANAGTTGLPRVSRSDLALVRSLPTPLRTPVAGLWAAVRRAASTMGRVRPAAVERGLDAIMRHLSTMTRSRVVRPGAHPARGILVPSFPQGLPGTAVTLGRDHVGLPRALDHARASGPRAAELVAAALDRYLPAIRAHAAVAPSTGAGSCDALDATPLLCVGSDAGNTYTSTAMLVLDLGGDDAYTTGVGAAPFVPAGGTGAIPLSVSVDVGGNDRYVASLLPSLSSDLHGDAVAGMGAALPGGVGITIDLAGDDEYTAVADPAHSLPALSQGVGAGGIGLLFDEGSDYGDRYVVQTSPGTHSSDIAGQGAGLLGVGALVDAGAGTDTFGLIADTVQKDPGPKLPFVTIAGQGMGNGGTGLLFDDGAGAFTASSGAAWVPGDDEEVPDFAGHPSYSSVAPAVSMVVQGSAYGGAGFLLGGAGADSYRATTAVDGIAVTQLFAQGTGPSGGPGVLDDAGGSDTYRVADQRSYVKRVDVDDAGCVAVTGETCPSAVATVDDILSTAPFVMAQGSGWLGGTGLLLDHGSDGDTYEARSETRLSVTLDDHLAAPVSPPTLEVTSSNHQPQLVAQGASSLGQGTLIDQGGTDTYVATYLKQTSAEAFSDHAAGQPSVRSTSVFRLQVAAQGSVASPDGTGALLDLGGAGDRFTASALIPAGTAPDPSGAQEYSPLWPSLQGGGQGNEAAGVFVALGQTPVAVSSPSQPVCPASSGYRGFGAWEECTTSGLVGGLVPATDADHSGVDAYGAGSGTTGATGVLPSLAFTPGTPDTAAGGSGRRVDVGAVLKDSAGNPIPGATLHFDLQYNCSFVLCDVQPPDGTVESQWLSGFTFDAITGSDGVATTTLPLDGTDLVPANWQWRLFVTYDGAAGRYPRHAAKRIALTF